MQTNDLEKTRFAGDYIVGLKACLDALSLEQIAALLEKLEAAYWNGKQVFIIGNGGSAATAAHMACDLSNNVVHLDGDQPRFRVMSLADNVPLMTALANDRGYEFIFSEQLKNLCQPGDLLIAISGSGNSPNILAAIQTAKTIGATVVGILGFDGGKAKDLVDSYVHVQSDHYGFIEDVHMVLDHLVTAYFKTKMNLGRE